MSAARSWWVPSAEQARPLQSVAAIVVFWLAACGDDDAGHDAAPDTEIIDVTETDIAPEVVVPPTLSETLTATPLGLTALSVNGRIQPRGRPTTYYFELGPDDGYGTRTEPQALAPKIGAYYHESWSSGLAGWAGGMTGLRLEHFDSGGADGADGAFVRHSFPGDIDAAHADGTGANELLMYLYPGAWRDAPVFAALGGGDPDFRRAEISLQVRGNDFFSNGSELVFWMQSTPNLAESYDAATARWSNWLYSGVFLTDALYSGAWEQVSYRLVNDTNAWSYSGHYVAAGRETYIYVPLDQVLGHLNGDIFHMQVFFEFHLEPRGAIDFDELTIAYANRSLLVTSNGGTLVSAPPGDDPARLTDGWRHGPERAWASEVAPAEAPLELVWQLADPVAIEAIEIHQNPDWPSEDVEVLGSVDGVVFTPLAAGTLPRDSPHGPNFAFWLAAPEPPAEPSTETRWIKVRVHSGYQPERWGLGEVEVFGQGAVMQTDDDWYGVTTDFGGLTAGTTYHYRVVAESEAGTSYGDDMTFTVPATPLPLVSALTVSHLAGGTAKVAGRIAPLGVATNFWFEYGPDTDYGTRTGPRYSGLELTPRTVTDMLVDLVPGATYHLRLAAENASGIAYSDDVVFVAE